VLGGFAVQSLGQPMILLVILVAGKTLADWKLEQVQRNRQQRESITS
jgi:hypothetical protein